MMADNESIEDNSLNGLAIIDGENFLIGQRSTTDIPVLGHVGADADTGTVGASHFVGHSNSMDLSSVGFSSVASMLQIVTANNQCVHVEPLENKVPIEGINTKSVSPEGILVTPTVPSAQPSILSKPIPMALDYSGTDSLASRGLTGQSLLLQSQNEDTSSVSIGASLPVSKLL
jgi:hypothetical protein